MMGLGRAFSQRSAPSLIGAKVGSARGRSAVSSRAHAASGPDDGPAFTMEEAGAIRHAAEELLASQSQIVQRGDERSRLWQRARDLDSQRDEVLRPLREASDLQRERRLLRGARFRVLTLGAAVALGLAISIRAAGEYGGHPWIPLVGAGLAALCCVAPAIRGGRSGPRRVRP